NARYGLARVDLLADGLEPAFTDEAPRDLEYIGGFVGDGVRPGFGSRPFRNRAVGAMGERRGRHDRRGVDDGQPPAGFVVVPHSGEERVAVHQAVFFRFSSRAAMP